MTLGFEYYL